MSLQLFENNSKNSPSSKWAKVDKIYRLWREKRGSKKKLIGGFSAEVLSLTLDKPLFNAKFSRLVAGFGL